MSTQKYEHIRLGTATTMDRFMSRMARKYFMGADVDSMIRGVKGRNGRPIVLDWLGENATEKTKQWRADTTKLLADVVEAEELNARIAVRPGQFDLDYRLMREVVGHIARSGGFAWIDMERAVTVDQTIAAYKTTAGEYPSQVGLALQAYLKRTGRDIEGLVDFATHERVPIHIRPVRGVYVDESDFRTVPEMHENLARMMHFLAACKSDIVFQHVGSHHPEQMARAVQLRQTFGETVVSIQLLLGVYKQMAENLETQLKMPMELYVPFGPNTAAYLIRRLEEANGAVRGLLFAGLREKSNFKRTVRLANEYYVDMKDSRLPFFKKADICVCSDTPGDI